MIDSKQFEEEAKKLAAEEIRRSLLDPNKTHSASPLDDEKIKDAEQDRELKRKYAHWFIQILIGQLFIMNIIFFLVGLSWLQFDNWALNLYTGGTLAEVFGVVLVITKNLFPSRKF